MKSAKDLLQEEIEKEEKKLAESKGKDISENMHQYALAVLRNLLKKCQEK